MSAFFVFDPLPSLVLGKLCGICVADGELAETWGVLTWGFFEVEEVMGGGGGRFVTRAKRARSGFRGGQGREERRPMPRWGVVATMRVMGGWGREGGIGVVVVVVVVVEGVGVEGVILWCCGGGRRMMWVRNLWRGA